MSSVNGIDGLLAKLLDTGELDMSDDDEDFNEIIPSLKATSIETPEPNEKKTKKPTKSATVPAAKKKEPPKPAPIPAKPRGRGRPPKNHKKKDGGSSQPVDEDTEVDWSNVDLGPGFGSGGKKKPLGITLGIFLSNNN